MVGFRLLEFWSCDYRSPEFVETRDFSRLILLQNQLSIWQVFEMSMLLYQQQNLILIDDLIQNLFTLMSCPYCHPQDISLSRAYNIENVHQRFIPTYYHTQIFAPVQAQPQPRIRCSATFHSQILNNPQAKKNIIKNPQYHPPGSNKEVAYKNLSKGLKQDQFYNKRGNCCYRSNELWYDSSKADAFKKLQCCRANYAHDRKQVDLGSNPIFGGVTIDACSCVEPNTAAEEVPVQQIQETKPQKSNYNCSQNPVYVDEDDRQHESSVESIQREAQIQTDQEDKKQVPTNAETQTVTFLPKKKTSKKVNAFNRTVVEGRPTFTIIRKRDW